MNRDRGNFISLLTLQSEHDPEYSSVVLKMILDNCQLTSPIVQKDIINACVKETTKAILEELNGGIWLFLLMNQLIFMIRNKLLFV